MTQPTPCRPDGEPIPCRGCQYFTGPGCGCDDEGHTRPQNPGPRPGLDEISSDDLDTLYDRADGAEAEVDKLRAQLTSRTVLLEGHLTVQTQRAERAEAAIERVRAVAHWINRNYPGLDHDHRILAVLDEHQEQQPATPPVHIGDRANAEDCPACSGTNLPYPFICPGPKDV